MIQPRRRSPRALRARGIALPVSLFAAAAWAASAPLPARAQNLFAVTRGPVATLLSINPDSGQATPRGTVSTGAPVLSLAQSAPATFLLGGTTSGDLVRIDPNSGAATLIGSTGSTNPLFALSFFGGDLFGIQGPLGGIENLVRINTATGAASLLGAITDGVNFPAARGLTVRNGQLITADAGLGAGGDLFSLNPANGFATNLTAGSPTGIPLNGLRSLQAIGGTLYALNDDPTDPNVNPQTGYALYTLDAATAQARLVGPVNLVPEPGTLALAAGTALPCLPVLLRRRRCSRRRAALKGKF